MTLGSRALDSFVQDLKYALRALRKAPAFTAVAALALALGIGANTVLFSVISFSLLRPLPYPDSDRLVVLNESAPNFPAMSVSYPDFRDWEAQSKDLFDSFGAARRESFNLTSGGEAERAIGRMVSAGLLPVTSVRPLLGRLFSADD